MYISAASAGTLRAYREARLRRVTSVSRHSASTWSYILPPSAYEGKEGGLRVSTLPLRGFRLSLNVLLIIIDLRSANCYDPFTV